METSGPLLPTPRANDAEKRGDIANDPLNGLPAAIAYKSTSSPEASPASLFPKPDEDEVRRMIAISGQRCFESYENFIRGGSSVKMFAASLLGTTAWFSNKCTLTWKVKVTKSNRLLFRLYPSTPRTEETGSGLLQTPVADDAVERVKGKINSRGEPKLSGQIAMLPTPTAQTYGTNQSPSIGAAVRHSLDTLVKMLPTPRRSDGDKGVRSPEGYAKERERWGRKNGVDLPTMVATPNGEKSGLKLQPGFALWMMGYPTDWLDLEAGEMPPSKARATR